jgi:hypothetical protein
MQKTLVFGDRGRRTIDYITSRNSTTSSRAPSKAARYIVHYATQEGDPRPELFLSLYFIDGAGSNRFEWRQCLSRASTVFYYLPGDEEAKETIESDETPLGALIKLCNGDYVVGSKVVVIITNEFVLPEDQGEEKKEMDFTFRVQQYVTSKTNHPRLEFQSSDRFSKVLRNQLYDEFSTLAKQFSSILRDHSRPMATMKRKSLTSHLIELVRTTKDGVKSQSSDELLQHRYPSSDFVVVEEDEFFSSSTSLHRTRSDIIKHCKK